MIDPGHGGSAPGAVNKELNLKEKDIVMEVARYMVAELEENYSHILPFLTRGGDVSVSLDSRCRLASVYEVDIFVSIHTNARLLKGKYGIEIETFHCKGSKTGKRLASVIQKNLLDQRNSLPVIDRGVKVGERWSKKRQKMMPFYVLKYTRMPAVLVELGFLSDFEEAVILSSVRHQQAMGKILAQSVDEFFKGEI